jgi:hypothetical protein
MRKRLIEIFVFLMLSSTVFNIFGSKDETESIPQKKDMLPAKENLWVFMMAGQSNMAGRGKIETGDLVINKRIMTINEINEWIVAREPLHFYEPNGAGLDCGVSFARRLLKEIPDSVSIAMIPCAVGGSSVFEWLGDSLHRNVRLLSNFRWKLDLAKEKGVIKCILWHQGERNANAADIPLYKDALKELVFTFREIAEDDHLPVIMGELGRFAQPAEKQDYFNEINAIIHDMAEEVDNCSWISSEGLDHKGDHLHFNSAALRELGERYAEKYLETFY